MYWLLLLIIVGLPISGVLAIPLLAIWTHHKRKMEELYLQRQRLMSDDVCAEFTALRAEIKGLRDTTMQYDLSFDTTMQHLERRVVQLERQTSVTGSGRTATSLPMDTGITQTLYNGR